MAPDATLRQRNTKGACVDDRSDILIIGGGIAGLSLAAAIAGRATVRLLEQEGGLARHTSSRSARQMQPSYGPEPVRLLTEPSIGLVRGFERALGMPLLRPRPLYWLAFDEGVDLAPLRATIPGLVDVPVAEPLARLPILRPERVHGALLDPIAQEVDVPRLLEWYESEARRTGTEIVTGAPVEAIEPAGDGWTVRAGGRSYRADRVVNAAGAWADRVAALAGARPGGLVPLRRTVALAQIDAPIDPEWPMVTDAASNIYFRPDGDRLLASPLEDTPDEPHDARPLDEVVTRAADRLRRIISPALEITGAWTGLRTTAADGVPVVGFDAELPGFYWLAGQSGYGIQTSAAFGMLAAAALLDEPADASPGVLAAFASLTPQRLGRTDDEAA
jgi:D-arginine dehydrogenase